MIGEWNNGTGRRKSSVARVFLKKGSGQIVVIDSQVLPGAPFSKGPKFASFPLTICPERGV